MLALMLFVVVVGIAIISVSIMPVGVVSAQQPTGVLPTVTGTPKGPVISVRPQEQDQVNVRAGPGTTYPKVGVLIIGQQMPAKGRSVGGDWIMIEYPGVLGGIGWVYAPLVTLLGGEVPIVEPPPTPTPLHTPTIDPTLAARFIVTNVPTRLPTFTEPPPLILPTLSEGSTAGIGGGVPMGLVIIILAAGGIIVGLFSIAQGR